MQLLFRINIVHYRTIKLVQEAVLLKWKKIQLAANQCFDLLALLVISSIS
jgi:hypothetical protein